MASIIIHKLVNFQILSSRRLLPDLFIYLLSQHSPRVSQSLSNPTPPKQNLPSTPRAPHRQGPLFQYVAPPFTCPSPELLSPRHRLPCPVEYTTHIFLGTIYYFSPSRYCYLSPWTLSPLPCSSSSAIQGPHLSTKENLLTKQNKTRQVS